MTINCDIDDPNVPSITYAFNLNANREYVSQPTKSPRHNGFLAGHEDLGEEINNATKGDPKATKDIWLSVIDFAYAATGCYNNPDFVSRRRTKLKEMRDFLETLDEDSLVNTLSNNQTWINYVLEAELRPVDLFDDAKVLKNNPIKDGNPKCPIRIKYADLGFNYWGHPNEYDVEDILGTINRPIEEDMAEDTEIAYRAWLEDNHGPSNYDNFETDIYYEILGNEFQIQDFYLINYVCLDDFEQIDKLTGVLDTDKILKVLRFSYTITDLPNGKTLIMSK